MNESTDTLIAGISTLNEGITATGEGATTLSASGESLNEGTEELYSGVQELTDGTGEFVNQTSDLDQQIDEKIDDALTELSGSDYVVTSFTSAENENVESLQFAMKTSGIKVEEQEQEETVEESQNFVEKFLDLFH